MEFKTTRRYMNEYPSPYMRQDEVKTTPRFIEQQRKREAIAIAAWFKLDIAQKELKEAFELLTELSHVNNIEEYKIMLKQLEYSRKGLVKNFETLERIVYFGNQN